MICSPRRLLAEEDGLGVLPPTTPWQSSADGEGLETGDRTGFRGDTLSAAGGAGATDRVLAEAHPDQPAEHN